MPLYVWIPLVYASLRLDTLFMPLYVWIPLVYATLCLDTSCLCHSTFGYLLFMPLYVWIPLVYATLRLDISRHYFVICLTRS